METGRPRRGFGSKRAALLDADPLGKPRKLPENAKRREDTLLGLGTGSRSPSAHKAKPQPSNPLADQVLPALHLNLSCITRPSTLLDCLIRRRMPGAN